MSKRESKKRDELISALLNGGQDDFWLSTHEIMEFTGRTQPSIHRSLKDLLDSGLIERVAHVFDCYKGLPKRQFMYIHKDNKEKQLLIDEKVKIRNEKEKAEAKALGKSVLDYRLGKLFKG